MDNKSFSGVVKNAINNAITNSPSILFGKITQIYDNNTVDVALVNDSSEIYPDIQVVFQKFTSTKLENGDFGVLLLPTLAEDGSKLDKGEAIFLPLNKENATQSPAFSIKTGAGNVVIDENGVKINTDDKKSIQIDANTLTFSNETSKIVLKNNELTVETGGVSFTIGENKAKAGAGMDVVVETAPNIGVSLLNHTHTSSAPSSPTSPPVPAPLI